MLASVFGVDPGTSGGISWLWLDHLGAHHIESVALAKLTRREAFEWITERAVRDSFGLLEKVAPMPAFDPKTKKPRSMGAKSAFTFGGSFERCHCILDLAGVRYEEIRPVDWQKIVGLYYPKGSTQTEKKRMGRGKAQSLFPNAEFRITTAVADSMLIAYAAFRKESLCS